MRRLVVGLLFMNIIVFSAYGSNISERDSIILKAMRDELNRNMNDLVYADFEKSFFISYTIADINEIFISSSLGALITSKKGSNKTWAARLMVGNYQINDENYDDYNNIETNEIDIVELPVDDDYYGIRRTLWAVTNNVYKRAALSYKNKLMALKQNNLADTSLQIPDFSESPAVKIYNPPVTVDFRQSEMEDLTKDISESFTQYPEIINSSVSIDAYHSRIYFINSEGTESVTSEVIFTLQVMAEIFGKDGEPLSNSISYHVTSPDELPLKEKIVNEVSLMVDNLRKIKDAGTLGENYYGPVLLMEQAVSQAFEKSLFSGSDKLVASREPLINSPQMKMYYSNKNSIEDKINKRIASNDITVKAYPRLKEFNGTKLLGSFDIDAEGVVPPDELVLIENGILKTLLCDRTPTRKIKVSNGHKRYAVSYGNIAKQTGPGVISVSSSNNMSLAELKQKLLEQAKSEGLDFGIIVRPAEIKNSGQPLNIYRIWVEDGREELISSAYLKKLPSNSLKRIIGTAGDQKVYNTFSGTSEIISDNSLSRGMMVTYLVPEAVLFEESEIINVLKPISSAKPVTKSPLELLHQNGENP